MVVSQNLGIMDTALLENNVENDELEQKTTGKKKGLHNEKLLRNYWIPFDKLYFMLEYDHPDNDPIRDKIVSIPVNGITRQIVCVKDIDPELVLGISSEELDTFKKPDGTVLKKSTVCTCSLELFNCRESYGTVGEIKELRDSIIGMGFQRSFPLEIYRLPHKDLDRDYYIVVDGHRRTMVSWMLRREGAVLFDVLPASNVETLKSEYFLLAQYTKARGQKKPSWLEVAKIIDKWQRDNPDRGLVDLAKTYNIDPAELSRCKTLASAHPKVLSFVRQGMIGESRAYDIMIKHPDNYVTLIKQIAAEDILGKRVSRTRMQRVEERTKNLSISSEQRQQMIDELVAVDWTVLPASVLSEVSNRIKRHQDKISHYKAVLRQANKIRKLVDTARTDDGKQSHLDEKYLKKELARPIFKELTDRGLWKGKTIHAIANEIKSDLEMLQPKPVQLNEVEPQEECHPVAV